MGDTLQRRPRYDRGMKLTGLHLLLTYKCNLECDHCFVWGSPWQTGVISTHQIWQILGQAQELGSLEWIYFEGGEPFLYYPILLKGVRQAARLGFQVGVVSNGYWATSEADAMEWLRPLGGLVQDLSVSSDLYHWSDQQAQRAQHAEAAAKRLGIPFGAICIAQPEDSATHAVGQLPSGNSQVMYRGRAAAELTARAQLHPAKRFEECPFEDLRDPGRVHVDPFGNLHLCQGISLGNLFQIPLAEICERYQPDSHPIAGPLLRGGPAELARRHQISPSPDYADACHMCYQVRARLRERYPAVLTPGAMYGEFDGAAN